MESIFGDVIQIEDQRVQVKGAFHLLDLEWKALLPGSYLTPSLIPPKSFQKLTKHQSDPVVFPQNIEDDQLTIYTTEETIREATEVNSGEENEKDDDTVDVLKQLINLAKERQWDPPIFKLVKKISSNNKRPSIICTVLLNGQVYKQPAGSKVRASRSSHAKKIAAKFCLKALKEMDQNQNQPENNFIGDNDQKDDDISPITTLRELSKKLYGISPEFKIVKVSNKRKYYCRVVLNGKMYTPPMSTSSDTAEEAKTKASQYCLEKLEKDDGILAKECLSAPPSHLTTQFTEISEFIEIPDDKFQQTVQIARALIEALRKRVPSTKVVFFRNWYLKLRNSLVENEPLFIYIYAKNGIPESDGPPSEDNFTWLPGKLIQQAISENSELIVCSEDNFPNPDDQNETRIGCKFLYNPSGISITLVNFKRTMVEVQCCRLVKYFCEFDPRIRPLLILARYWLLTNEIQWGEPEVAARISHQCLSQMHTLDWMILTFLMAENYVPSLRTILEKPHQVIFERATVTDIGFSADVDFAREWRRDKDVKRQPSEQFILSTLQIFQNFLEFCSTKIFDQGGVIINPKDGEILKTSEFFNGEVTSKLTLKEISVLKQFQENSDNERKGQYCVDFKRWNWYMINPLITNWRFSVPGRRQERIAIEFTRETNERLRNFLKLLENEEGGAEKAFEICGASLCEILKVGRVISVLDPPIPSRPSRKRRLDSCEVNEEYDNGTEEVGSPKKKKIKLVNEPALVTFDLEKSPPKRNEESLAHQLYRLLVESVVIPKGQFNKVLESVNFLQKVFFHSNDPTCKVSLFRSWNLKLKSKRNEAEDQDMPLVYVYNRKYCPETDSGFSLLPSGKIWSILKSREVKKKINVLEGPTPKGQDPSTFKKGWTLEWKKVGRDKKFNLCLFSSHKFIFEVEIDGLLEYMCKFDGRAYQMIKLAYLWMGLNELTLVGEGEVDGGLASLQWLVIFWMCHKKMVPSPKEIQKRGCHKVMRDGGTGVDLGWEEDNQFLEEWREINRVEEFEWREDCVVGLLYGFKEFLEFCGWLVEGSGASWILNTRNGVLIEKKQILKSGDILGDGNWCKSMNEEEVRILKTQVVNFKEQRIYMTHPLNLQWRFGLRSDIGFVFKLMKVAGMRLRTYLNMRKSNGEKLTRKRFKSLKNVLTLTDEDFNKVKNK